MAAKEFTRRKEQTMKKSKFLIPVLALGLLAGCAPETTCSSCSTTTDGIEPVTFAQQCEEAGIEFTWVDPNAAIAEAETKPAEGEEDCVEAAGTLETSYTAEAGGSYYTYEYMVKRSGLKYAEYYWAPLADWTPGRGETEDDKPTGAKTIAEAAELDNAEYVTALFPNDGAEYYVATYSNSIATKVFIATGLDGVTHTAVYNTAASYDAETNVATWMPGITSIEGIGNAILESGKCDVIMYEYNPTSNDKVGPGARNFGARMECELNVEASSLMLSTGDTITGTAIGNIGDTLPENAYYYHPALEVVKMYSLG